MPIDINNSIVKIKLQTSEKLLAQVEVIFANVLETKGWRIMPSSVLHPRFQEPIWIQPPCFKAKGSWYKTVYINDSRLYEAIEEKIYDEFCKARSKNGNQAEHNESNSIPI